MSTIAFLNEEGAISDSVLGQIIEALKLQAPDYAALWGQPPPEPFAAKKSAIASDQPRIYMVKKSPVKGALGFHEELQNGLIMGIVAVQTIAASGGTLLEGPGSVSQCASHEWLEATKNPFTNAYCDVGDGFHAQALETGDPVQGNAYEVTLSDGTKVSVSNFVGPEYFDPYAKGGKRFDWMGKLTAPFTVSDDPAGGRGYTITRDLRTGKVTASEAYAERAHLKGHYHRSMRLLAS